MEPWSSSVSGVLGVTWAQRLRREGLSGRGLSSEGLADAMNGAKKSFENGGLTGLTFKNGDLR